jgi:acyl-[acyl-carrier-protein]-phospholipid O-acyltransferase / long-chain-fatty-acid--[acyl-carrier-protein] ligase
MEPVRAFFRIALLPLIRLAYRLRVLGADRVPGSGGVLLIANHVSYLDSFILYAACPRPVRFVIVSRYMKVAAIRWFLDLFGAIPITPGKPRDAIRATADRLRGGDVVCIFPEGQLTRTGLMNELKKGFELIARQSGAPVVPVYMHGLWGSIFSGERGRYFRKWPYRLPWPVAVAFGPPIAAGDAHVDWARAALLAASADAFAALPQLETSLAAAAIRSLKRHRRQTAFAEHGKSIRRLKRHHVLSTSVALASRWRADPSPIGDDRRIGLLLPGGTAPALLNLALIFSGRVPVNLPFPDQATGELDTAGIAASIRAAGLGTVITSRAFFGPLGSGGLDGVEFLDFGAEMGATGLGRLFSERFLAFFEPAWLTLRRLGLPRRSSPDPVWAAVENGQLAGYSDRAILAETLRLASGSWIESGETLFTEQGLSSLPNALWSLWLPVLQRHAAVGRSWASRTDPALIETVCGAESVRRIILSPRILEEIGGMEEPWHPELRRSLRSLLAAAETPADLTLLDRRSDRAKSVTGAPLCPYWPTASGIVAISQPAADPAPLPPGLESQPGGRARSPGKLLPGLVNRGVVCDPNGFVEWSDPAG